MVNPQKDRHYNYLSYLFGGLLEIILAQKYWVTHVALGRELWRVVMGLQQGRRVCHAICVSIFITVNTYEGFMRSKRMPFTHTAHLWAALSMGRTVK